MTRKRKQLEPSFRLFAHLPLELREQIWEDAIQNRDAEALAHFFTVDEDDGYTMEREITKNDRVFFREEETAFGPPAFLFFYNDEDSDRGWNRPDNPSGYLLDSGLWSACTESRRVVIRHWAARRGPRVTVDPDSQADYDFCEWNFRQVNEDEKDHTAVIATRVPELCVNRSCLVFTRPVVDVYIFQMPFLRLVGNGELYRSIRDYSHGTIQNIAFDYDPYWKQVPDRWRQFKNSDSGLGGLARQYEYILDAGVDISKRLWLIGHNLVPNKSISYDEIFGGGERMVFTARGRRYIEVLDEDLVSTLWQHDSAGGAHAFGANFKSPFYVTGVFLKTTVSKQWKM